MIMRVPAGCPHFNQQSSFTPSTAASKHETKKSLPILSPKPTPTTVEFQCLECGTTTNEYQSIQCDGDCKEWFHTECIPLTAKQVKDLTYKIWVCKSCTQPQRPQTSYS